MKSDKLEIQLFFDGANSRWIMDAEKIDGNLVLFGFEEHDDELKKVFKTEQILDKEDLVLVRHLINSILGDAS